jgi:hypothetical protein
MKISMLTSSGLGTVLALAAFVGISITPAFAQEYQVTVTLLGDTTIPAPVSYTFDTTTPFQTSGSAAISNLSVVFDSDCFSLCGNASVTYNANESQISYNDGSFSYQHAVGCSTFFFSGGCDTNPSINVSQVGVTYGSQASGGTILVSAVSAVPESSSYLELAGMGLGLACFGFRRFSSKQRA